MDLVFVSVLSLAVVYDLRERRIPNALTVGGLLAALILRLLLDPSSAAGGLFGAGLALGVALPLFAFGVFGAGDGKLLVMVGAYLGLDGTPAAILATGVFGGILALVHVCRRGTLFRTLRQLRDGVLLFLTLGRVGRGWSEGQAGGTVPYGVAIAAGAMVVWATGVTLP